MFYIIVKSHALSYFAMPQLCIDVVCGQSMYVAFTICYVYLLCSIILVVVLFQI
jgi:hypothetical protein